MAFKKREQVMESDSEEEGRRYESEDEEQSVNNCYCTLIDIIFNDFENIGQ
jgi:hypothetical protein